MKKKALSGILIYFIVCLLSISLFPLAAWTQCTSCEDCSPPIIELPSQQMSCGGNQIINVSGGQAPFRWLIDRGGGALSDSSGTSVTYTAPSSNANCINNPTIAVIDSCGQSATADLAVNCYVAGEPAYKNAACSEGVPYYCEKDPGPWFCLGRAYTTQFVLCVEDSYTCYDQYLGGGFIRDCGCNKQGTCADDCVEPCADCVTLLSECNPPRVPGINDVRTPAMKAAGCCPATLLSMTASCIHITQFDSDAAVINQTGGQRANFSASMAAEGAGQLQWKLSVADRIVEGVGSPVSAFWDGKGASGKEVDPGIYEVTLEAWSADGSCIASDTKRFSLSVTSNQPQCLAVAINSSVNIASGNLNHSQVLFSLPDSGLMKEFSLTYNSLDGQALPLGTGWTHLFNMKVKPNNDGSHTLFEGDGSKVVLYNKGDQYTPEKSNYPALTVNADETSSLEKKKGIFYQFDRNGKITRILDRNSNAILFTYDNQNNLVLITDPSGRNVSFAYDQDNRIRMIIDPMGNTHSLSYSEQHLSEIVSSILGAGVQEWAYSYDENGFMLSKTDPLGNITSYTYDAEHRLSRVIDPEGRSRSISYNPSNLMSQITKKDGGIWTYQYDSQMGVLTARIDPLGGIETYEYDENRNIIKATDPNGHVTQYEYNGNANVTLIQDPLGGIETYAYNELNKVTSRTDSLGNVSRFTYDTRGNLISITDPIGGVSNFSYDSRGNIVKMTNARGFETRLEYNQNNYLTSVTDAIGAVTNFSYDSIGNLINAIDGVGNVTGFEYSSLNRLLKMTDPLGNVTTNSYDSLGNRTSLQDANGNATFYEYNYKGQVTAIKDARGNITRATYGGAGCPACGEGVDQLTSLTDANGNATAYQYDAAGRLISETDPLGNRTAYAYDPAGNLVAKTDGNGHTILYSYDALNRLIQKTYPDGTKEVFEYDANGNILYAGNKDISYNFRYDNNGRLLNVLDSNGRMIQYQYDALGNRVQMTPPEGGPTDYRYDANNRLSEINAQGGSYRFVYDALGRRIQMVLPNGTSVDYSHDPGSRLTEIRHKTSGGSLIDQFAYTHDGVGNRLTKTQTDVQYAYSYDPTYQLIQALPNPLVEKKVERFGYDPVGNRLSGPQEDDFYFYDKGNQITWDSRFGYEHDKIGNLIKKTLTDEDGRLKIFTYEYDYENRLVKAEIRKADKVKVIMFTYDPFGRRISKTILRQDLLEGENVQDEDLSEDLPRMTQFVYDDEDIILAYNRRGKVKARYVHGLGIDEPLAVEKKGNIYYYHTDGLGSITALTDELGQIFQQYEYDSFGRVTKNGALIGQPYTFMGREWDQETGLYYYRARYYDPRAGRFLTKDPIWSMGGDVNLYRFASNNPIRYRDPWGLWEDDVHSGIGNPNYGTYTWAKNLGLSDQQATWIATGDKWTDGGFSGWLPILGLQSRHFNQWPFNMKGDSRDYWAEIELRRAVDYYKKGNCEAAFGHLGKGLHSIQDKMAHGDWDTGLLGTYRHPKWYDSWSDPRNKLARKATEEVTQNYILLFLKLIGQR